MVMVSGGTCVAVRSGSVGISDDFSGEHPINTR